jgi:hypothetical protein
VIERTEGEFDFSFHEANRDQCQKLGLAYVVYPWVHVLPWWYRFSGKFEGFRCLEHDQECGWPSIFSPETLPMYRRFYGAVQQHLGSSIDSLCVAIPADYGEVGYPTGWGAWVSQPPPPLNHIHSGFWVGDPHARAAFRKRLLQRYGDLDAVNRELQSNWAQELDMTYPDLSSSKPHRLEFANFYLESLTGFLDQLLSVVRDIFPQTPLSAKVGHGGEILAYGIDPSLIVKVCQRHQVMVRTTQATLPDFHQRRLSSPCQLYQVPFTSEPPVDVADASCGAQEYFDYPEHVVGSRDLLERYGELLNGELPCREVGIFFPSTDQHLHPEQGLPPVLVDMADALRDRFDFEVVDEPQIADGALDGLRVLGIIEAHEVLPKTQAKIVEWVRNGGRLVVGPEVKAAQVAGPLGDLLRQAPDASEFLDLVGMPGDSMIANLGELGDHLRLAGHWYYREGAHQFHGTPPNGEYSRWSGEVATAFFPVRGGRNYLLEIECWLHPSSVHLRHDVTVNGKVVGRIQRPGLQRFAAWVSEELLRGQGVASVSVESETFCLAESGDSEDQRHLGVAIEWLRMTEEGSPAAGFSRGEPPHLVARVHETDLRERGLHRVGEGALLISRTRPSQFFLALLEQEIREHCPQIREALEGSSLQGPTDGLRVTVFPSKVLLWNRQPTPREVELKASGHSPEVIMIPAGGIVGMDRESGRVLP